MDCRPEVKGQEVAIARSVNGAWQHNCPVCIVRQKSCYLTMKNCMRKSVWSHNSYEPHGLQTNGWLNSDWSFSGILKKPHFYSFCDQFLFRSDAVPFAVRHQGLFPCSCSDEKKNSINKIRLHRRGMSCCHGNPPTACRRCRRVWSGKTWEVTDRHDTRHRG